jgi:hypothetical protein
MSYNLFLDDMREPRDVKWISLPLVDWEVARNYKEFVSYIEKYGLPEIISFDHDLADEHYNSYHMSLDEHGEMKGEIKYDGFKEKTGHDCAKWLAEYCLDKNLPIPVYYLHSMNHIGCLNIDSILKSARKVQNER